MTVASFTRITPVRFRAWSSSAANAANVAAASAQRAQSQNHGAFSPAIAFSPSPKPKTSVDAPVLRMLMFGKPGSGKGTLSNRLLGKHDLAFLSAGDILRQNISEQTEVGRIAEQIVAAGGLLPDDVITEVVTNKLNAPSLEHRPWILDGFPRTVGQGELLDAYLRNKNTPLTLIVNLNVPDNIILSRIADRWVHLPSGRVYNMSYNRPKVEGRDDVTGDLLSKRPDDNPEIFARRLKAFYDQTAPLLAYYSSSATPTTRMVTLSGETSDEIWPQLDAVVQQTVRWKPAPGKDSTLAASPASKSVPKERPDKKPLP
ncbi:adenylate kinase [Auriculariales sp. MPI-PUGE-AT-0066]|nr:adenylate kinase [Auriculariales sp. MPI-PUGE-AT-0066]